MANSYVIRVLNADGAAVAKYDIRAGTGARSTTSLKLGAGERIQLVDPDTGRGPAKVSAKRIGDELRVSFDAADGQPDVSIKEFFKGCGPTNSCQILGEKADGSLAAYQLENSAETVIPPAPATGDASGGVMLLGQASPVAAPLAAATAGIAPSSGGLSSTGMVAVGLAGLGLAAAAGGGGGSKSTPADTTPPTATASVTSFVDNSGSITGTLANASMTDDSSPTLHGTLTGTLEAGDRVVVLRNDTAVGYATVNGATWEFTDALAGTGFFSYRVAVVDAAGNRGTASGQFVVNLSASGTSGDSGNDTLTGDDSANSIRGNGGNDTLNGAGGDDRLYGGTGADTLNGGAGFDYAQYDDASTSVVANLASPAGNTGDATGDTYTDIEGLVGSAFSDILTGNGVANILIGGGGNDALNGMAGDDQLFGDAGNDALSGGDGIDQLYGGAGADALDGGDGIDYARYDGASAAVVANLATPAGNTGDASGDTYLSIEGLVGTDYADTLTGDANDNGIIGGLGIDTINGAAGSDTIKGGGGSDTLTGAAGDDRFEFNMAGGEGADTVTDLSRVVGNNDVISLFSVLDVDGIAGLGVGDLNFGAGVQNRIVASVSGADGVLTIGAPGAETVVTFTNASALFTGATAADLVTSGVIQLTI